MSDSKSWPRNLHFKNLQKSISRLGSAIEVASRREFELGRKEARVALEALPLRPENVGEIPAITSSTAGLSGGLGP